MTKSDQEKRKYIRIGTSLLVSYTLIKVPQERKESVTKDISGGGIRLPLKEKIAVDSLLNIWLELLKERKRIMLNARVVWIKSTPDNKKYPYEAGIEFIDIDRTTRTMISNCIQYLNRSELLRGVLF